MGFENQSFFVTGGAGFIGTALFNNLNGSFSEWTVYDNLLEQVHGKSPVVPSGDGVNFIKGDIRDFSLIKKALEKSQPDVLIHLAAETGTGQSAELPELHTDVNVNGTAFLIHALNELKKKPKVIVLTSSRAVYGEGPWKNSVGEITYPLGRSKEQLEDALWDYTNSEPLPVSAKTTLPTPCNIYGATKLAQEHLLSAWCAANDVKLVILRLQNVYGPGQSPINPYTGVTNFFFETSSKGKEIPVFEDGNIFRDFVFIDDVVQAIVTGINLGESAVADVGSGVKHSILDLAKMVAKITKGPEPVINGNFRLGDVRHAACDMTNSLWVRDSKDPEPLESGLLKLYAWLKTQSSFKL